MHDEDYDGEDDDGGPGGSDDDNTGPLLDGGSDDTPHKGNKSNRKPRKDKTNDADWWKRGEAPPF